MKVVYQLTTDASAPSVEIVGGMGSLDALLTFDGQEKWRAWPKEPPPEVRIDRAQDSPFVFYRLAPGALVVRSDVFTTCEDFHWVTRDGCERLPLKAGATWLEVIHPVVVLPVRVGGVNGPPCDVDGYHSALFRIEGRPTEHLFCVSGVSGVPLDDFKSVYDEYGFTGLHFSEIWRGEM
jgi:hypothetical protein